MHDLDLSMKKKKSGESKLRNILQNNWALFFKTLKFMEVKERLRNYQVLKKIKKIWPLNAIGILDWILRHKKGHSLKNWWKSNKVCNLEIVLIIVLWLYRMLTFGEFGWRVSRNSYVLFLQFINKSKLLQNKQLFKLDKIEF